MYTFSKGDLVTLFKVRNPHGLCQYPRQCCPVCGMAHEHGWSLKHVRSSSRSPGASQCLSAGTWPNKGAI